MAKRKVKKRGSTRRGRGKGGTDWKKSKNVMYALVGVIVLVWIFFVIPRVIPGCNRPDVPEIPQAFISELNGPITTYTRLPGPRPPYEDTHTGEQTAWEAFTCTRPDCIEQNGGEPPIFPKVWDEPPPGIEPPDPETMPMETPDGMPSEEWEAWMMYEEEQMMRTPVCPICGTSDPEYVQRYQTEKAKQMIEEIRARYAKD